MLRASSQNVLAESYKSLMLQLQKSIAFKERERHLIYFPTFKNERINVNATGVESAVR